jgi:hypothetical protein
MKALLAATIIMGVLIVAGTATLAVLIVRRVSVGPAAQSAELLHEPPGTRMVGIAGAGDRVAVLLQGGGPDRVLLLDARSGKPAGRVALGE